MCNVEKWNQQEAAWFQQQFRSGLVLTAKNAAKNTAQFSLAVKIASSGSIMIFSAGCNEDNEDCCDEVCDWWNTENDSVAGHTFTISTKTQIDTITSLSWSPRANIFCWFNWKIFGNSCGNILVGLCGLWTTLVKLASVFVNFNWFSHWHDSSSPQTVNSGKYLS